MEDISTETWQNTVSSLWALWRCRNDCAFQGKRPSFQDFSRYMTSIEIEVMLIDSLGKPTKCLPGGSPILDQCQGDNLVCHVDGSWAFGWIGGAGFIFPSKDLLIAYCSERVTAYCAIQAEACALQWVIDYAIKNGLYNCHFLSDCQVLVNACTTQQPPVDVDWKAHKEMYDIWRKLKV
ncbi:hypothetical protein FCM35_KLT05343 [Carex littledalei]|uniref:RNase H type-1 domain-containing protein n=1 Tax=Carex littledalei TaxID=544730 RepID=A0A833V9N4_9POAL|nr:hypothetical protein FCM35_KLT05343 [Carex littledalei]